MYKVFVNGRLLTLTANKPKIDSKELFDLDPKSIHKAIDALQSKKIKQAYIYGARNKKNLLESFKETIPVVVAAGGKVVNNKGKILFIYRNNKWDLPKGKLDKGEKIEAAALREVEEETGVGGLKIKRSIAKTYHIFERGGGYKLKETHWFEMETSYTGKLTAQLEEGITKVRWKGKSKTRKALENSYPNIRLLFEYETSLP